MLWLHGRESQHFSNAPVVGQEHDETVDTHTETTGGRKTVLESPAEGLINALGLVITLVLLAGLFLETQTLLGGNVQLSVAKKDLKSVNSLVFHYVV